MRPPTGRTPNPEYENGETLVLAKVPTRENKIAEDLYRIEKDEEEKGILITHVNDLCWTVKPEYEDRVDKILKSFAVRKVEGGNFRFCGEEIEQDQEFTIRVTCKDTRDDQPNQVYARRT